MATRRQFIGLMNAALLANSLDSFAAQAASDETSPKGFELTIMATNWGFDGTIAQFCEKAKKQGYDGIELWWPMEKKDQDDLFAALKATGLQVGFLCGGSQSDPVAHLESFKKMINAAVKAPQRPLYINCHSGRDYFTYEQNKLFIDHTTQLHQQTGITICHESHRSRMLFAAHVARNFIEKNEALKLTLDISHWCNVHESLLQDQQETVALALSRVEHIHARVGHPEGPQVNDPRAPEWNNALQAHFNWWDTVIARKKKEGGRMTILTEFGPPDYMPTLPYTRQPVADQWAINAHMMEVLRKRYA
ncbi:MAG: sugar phosphate isomerase/epimerase [Bacteroidota bacterium]|nr:sugar phosphate isomerase/epimerase [Bacteroidota bacterium]